VLALVCSKHYFTSSRWNWIRKAILAQKDAKAHEGPLQAKFTAYTELVG
jgi:hypothetical protein